MGLDMQRRWCGAKEHTKSILRLLQKVLKQRATEACTLTELSPNRIWRHMTLDALLHTRALLCGNANHLGHKISRVVRKPTLIFGQA